MRSDEGPWLVEDEEVTPCPLPHACGRSGGCSCSRPSARRFLLSPFPPPASFDSPHPTLSPSMSFASHLSRQLTMRQVRTANLSSTWIRSAGRRLGPSDETSQQLDDSKKLSERQREVRGLKVYEV
eukprot:755125-Hanusia_phi.AAC.3